MSLAALAILWVGRALAAEGPGALVAALEVPDGVQVEASTEGGHWRFVVTSTRTRTLEVEIPDTEEERQAVLALLESLLVDLSLPEVAPAPVAPAPVAPAPVVPAPVPSPPEEAAPAPAFPSDLLLPNRTESPGNPLPLPLPLPAVPHPVTDATVRNAVSGAGAGAGTPGALGAKPAASRPVRPGTVDPLPAPIVPVAPVAPALDTPVPAEGPPRARARWPLIYWLALDAAARPGTTTSAGGAVGAWMPAGPSLQVGLAASLHPRQALAAARKASLAELGLEVEVLAQLHPWLRVRGGTGLVGRDYSQYNVRVHRSITPRLSSGAEMTCALGGLVFGLGPTLDLDLARIHFVDEEDSVLLFPLDLRSVLRIEFGAKRRTHLEDPNIGEAGARESEAPGSS